MTCSGSTSVWTFVALGVLSLFPGSARALEVVEALPPQVDRLLHPQKVTVEIFQMEGVPKLEVEHVINGQQVSLAGLFAPGGIQIEVVFRETPVPRVSPADYQELAEMVRPLLALSGQNDWYASILVAAKSDFGSLSLLPGPTRQMGIVFAEEHQAFGAQAPLAMFRSAAHELAHILNLHHEDWEGTSFLRDSTIEGYAPVDSVRWSLSESSVQHLRYDPDEFVRPAGVKFGEMTAEHAAKHRPAGLEDPALPGVLRTTAPSNEPESNPTPDVHVLGPVIVLANDLPDSEDLTTTREMISFFLTVKSVGARLADIKVAAEAPDGLRSLLHVRSPDPEEQSLKLPHVPLRVGPNTVVVTARDSDGRVAEKRIQVTREDIPRKFIAAVFGAQDYTRVSPPLKHSLDDARAMRDLFAGLGAKESEGRMFYRENPELETLRRGIAWLRRTAGKKDIAVLYFAGHGTVEGDAEVADNDHLAKYLLPVNADLGELYATALPMDEISKFLNQVKADTVLVILDTCYSGAAGGRSVFAESTRALLSDKFLERSAGKGRLLLTASGPNETAEEIDEIGHGVFTFYLLEGLTGKADTDGDRKVDVLELIEWVSEQVSQRTKKKQTPGIYGEARGPLPLWFAPE